MSLENNNLRWDLGSYFSLRSATSDDFVRERPDGRPENKWRGCVACFLYKSEGEPRTPPKSEYIAEYTVTYRNGTKQVHVMLLCGRHAMDVRNYLEQKHRE